VAVIEARDLTKRFGSTVAVDHLSFEVQPGSVTGFLGPNGAGKSTTIRLMLGLDRGSGNTTFDGRRFVELAHPMQQVGALLDAKAFHPTRTARNHLRVLAAASKINKKRADEVLEFVGLQSVAGKKPKEFSLGMGQRLGLAGALLGEPHTLILDEPANGLDPAGIQWLRSFLKDYAAQGRTVFVSSHLLAEMALMADQLVVIGRGKLITSGPVETFVSSASGTSVIVRGPNLAPLREALDRTEATVTELPEGDGFSVIGMAQEAVGDLAFERNVALHELMTRTASLEEAFLEATAGSEEFHLDYHASQSEPGASAGGGAPPPPDAPATAERSTP
jgi:ABC-2 type transport system ATP-binding protein